MVTTKKAEGFSSSKWRWIVGATIAILLPIIGFATGYGGLKARASSTTGDIQRIERTLTEHSAENNKKHEDVDKRLSRQDVGLAEQKVILLRVEESLKIIGLDVKKHLTERH